MFIDITLVHPTQISRDHETRAQVADAIALYFTWCLKHLVEATSSRVIPFKELEISCLPYFDAYLYASLLSSWLKVNKLYTSTQNLGRTFFNLYHITIITSVPGVDTFQIYFLEVTFTFR